MFAVGWLVGQLFGWFVDCLNMIQVLVNSAFYSVTCSRSLLYIDNIIETH